MSRTEKVYQLLEKKHSEYLDRYDSPTFTLVLLSFTLLIGVIGFLIGFSVR